MLAAPPARTQIRAFQTALLALLVLSGLAWVATDRAVAVEVDGSPRLVRTHARTVGGVLRHAGLRVGEHDLVAPAADSKVRDGERVVVRRGRPVDLVLDGKSRRVWVTALSVGEALAQLQVRSHDRAFVSASRSRRLPLGGLSLEVRTPAKVRIVVATRSARDLMTTAATVRDALAQANISVSDLDKVTPALDSYPAAGTVVRITRVERGRRDETAPIPFGVERRPDASLYKGVEKVLFSGRLGVMTYSYDARYTDGRLTAKRLLTKRVTRKPRNKVIGVGTRTRPSYMTRSTASVDHLNWPALARCESGGRPRAVSPNGAYRGLYQFSIGAWRSVGGGGDPIDASPHEQTYRAKLLYMRRGPGPWPHCGRYL